jgi:protein involved in polysaccharide export with SLBB domain
MRLWDALALAGGVTQPNIEYIYIIRHAPPTPESKSDVDLSSPTGPPADQVRLRRRHRAEPKKQSDLEAIGDLMGGTPKGGPMQVSSFAETAEGPGSGTAAPAPASNGTANGNGNGNGKLSRWVYRDGKWVRVSGEEAAQPATPAEPAEPAAPAEPEAPVQAPEPVEQPAPVDDNGSGVKPLEAMPAEPAAPVEPSQPEPAQPAPAPQAPAEDQTDPFGWSAMSGRDLVRVIAISRDKLERGSYRENVVIRENDVVYIPPLEIGEFYVTGEVLRPGVYSLTGRQVTIKMALAAAGGIGPLGWPENSILIRRIGESQEQIIPINVERIWRGLDPDMMLKPDDVLAIGTHWSSTFLAVLRNAFRMTYGFGFIYDRNFSDPLFVTPKSNRFTAL